MEQRAKVAAQYTADISRQKRQPGEHRDFLDVHVALGHQVQRNPRIEGLPGRLGKDSRRGNRVEITVFEQSLPTAFLGGCILQTCFLAAEDVVTFGIAKTLLITRVLVQKQPQAAPDNPQTADNQERQLPATLKDGPDHQRGRKQCAKRRADIEPADGHRALFGRKPFGGRLDACRQPRRLGQAEHAAEDRQTLPAGRECGGSAGSRPGDGEDRKAHLGADRVDDVARHGLHDGVAQLPGDNDVRVLLGGNAQLAHERRCCDGQRVACQVVDDQASCYQPHHPPPNAFYLHLFTLFIFRLAMSVPRPRP